MGVTIKDVAKKVGVTPATISMVINNNSRISEATRQKVWQAIKDLDYYPHAGARNLVLKRTHVIGVAATFFTSQFMLEALSGIEGAIRSTDYNLVLYGTRGLPKFEEDTLQRIVHERKVDGLIALTLDINEKLIGEYGKFNIPVVVVERDYDGLDCILVNNERGGFEATRHLISLGHRRIALLTGPEKEYTAKMREKGFQRALKDAGLAWDAALRLETQDYTRLDGLQLGKRLLAMNPRPTALFSSAGDTCALGVLQACREAGVSVPGGLSLVGYDDLPLSELVDTPLTTVRQPIQKMGALAVEHMLGLVKQEIQPGRQVFEPELIVRKSSGPLPSR